MSLLKNLKTDGLEKSQDRLGGFTPLNTDLYTGTIKLAYMGQSKEGAVSVTFHVDLEGKEYRETVYVTNKKGENFFLNKEDKTKKVPLPGFTIANDICMLTVEKELGDMETEEKTVKIYNYESRAEEPKAVEALTELHGKEISLAILNVLENKTKKNDTTGAYDPTPETREINTIDKVFHTDSKMTLVEAQNGKEKGEFWDMWVTKNKGVQRDKRTLKDGAQAGTAGRPPAAAPKAGDATPAPKKSLFGNK